MFDAGFAKLFQAVNRLREQLETACQETRVYLTEELMELRRLGNRYLDHWMALDERIEELVETFGLHDTVESLQSAHDGTCETNDIQVELESLSTPSDGVGWSLPHVIPTETSEAEETMSWLTSFRQGLAYYDLAMFDHASKSLHLVVTDTAHPVAELYLAAAHAQRGRSDLALHHLARVKIGTEEDLLRNAVDEVESHIRLSEGLIDEALACLKRIVERDPDFRNVWFNMGTCYARKGDFDAAERAFATAMKADPRDLEGLRRLGEVRLRLGRAEEAHDAARQGLRNNPQDVRFLYLLADAQFDLGHKTESLSTYRHLSTLDPAAARPWMRAAWILLQKGQMGEATALWKKRLTLYPNDSSGLFQLGTFLAEDDPVRAERILFQAMTRHPDQSLLWIALGQISDSRGDHRQAKSRFTRAFRDPRKPVRRLALYCQAAASFRQRKYREAETYARAASLLGPLNPAVSALLANVAERLGLHLEAERLRVRARGHKTEAPS